MALVISDTLMADMDGIMFLERARAMLVAGEMSVKEVAYVLGYPNAFAFSRQFAKFTGAPPSHFLRAP